MSFCHRVDVELPSVEVRKASKGFLCDELHDFMTRSPCQKIVT